MIGIVQNELTCSAHNLDHVFRVYNICLLLAKYEENVDLEILIPAALLHDIIRVEESNDKTGEIDHAVLWSVVAENI
ncbi:HD domain-containing protein [uncultured Clostridium sp.]|uniref:HD domain-containing protein n=1 Tax=uncultured Clostridium sp. TaxID=59620 RepID=UPI0028E31464|nr:HD domain-containing protein [uncultured Clostridium sp.]